jgi:hypothetical protein
MSNPLIGVVMLALFGLFFWLGIFATIRALLAFMGVILIAEAGFVGHALADAATWASHLTGSATAWAFGINAAIVLTIAAAVIFIHDLHPKNGAGKRTGWAGIALAALLVAGVSGWSGAHSVVNGVQSGVSNAKTITHGG